MNKITKFIFIITVALFAFGLASAQEGIPGFLRAPSVTETSGGGFFDRVGSFFDGLLGGGSKESSQALPTVVSEPEEEGFFDRVGGFFDTLLGRGPEEFVISSVETVPEFSFSFYPRLRDNPLITRGDYLSFEPGKYGDQELSFKVSVVDDVGRRRDIVATIFNPWSGEVIARGEARDVLLENNTVIKFNFRELIQHSYLLGLEIFPYTGITKVEILRKEDVAVFPGEEFRETLVRRGFPPPPQPLETNFVELKKKIGTSYTHEGTYEDLKIIINEEKTEEGWIYFNATLVADILVEDDGRKNLVEKSILRATGKEYDPNNPPKKPLPKPGVTRPPTRKGSFNGIGYEFNTRSGDATLKETAALFVVHAEVGYLPWPDIIEADKILLKLMLRFTSAPSGKYTPLAMPTPIGFPLSSCACTSMLTLVESSLFLNVIGNVVLKPRCHEKTLISEGASQPPSKGSILAVTRESELGLGANLGVG